VEGLSDKNIISNETSVSHRRSYLQWRRTYNDVDKYSGDL